MDGWRVVVVVYLHSKVEGHEFTNRLETAHGSTHSQTSKANFSDRGINDTLGTKLVQKTFGNLRVGIGLSVFFFVCFPDLSQIIPCTRRYIEQLLHREGTPFHHEPTLPPMLDSMHHAQSSIISILSSIPWILCFSPVPYFDSVARVEALLLLLSYSISRRQGRLKGTFGSSSKRCNAVQCCKQSHFEQGERGGRKTTSDISWACGVLGMMSGLKFSSGLFLQVYSLPF